jgi:hypothetical protein
LHLIIQKQKIMRNFKLVKTVILLFAVLAFSKCEENGAIQFVVKDSFPTPVAVVGLMGQSSYSKEDSVDISGLLDSGAAFIEANIDSVTLKLENYDGSPIIGSMKLTANGIVLLDEDVTLTSFDSDPIAIPEGLGGILDAINLGTLIISIEGITEQPIEDDDFIIVITPRVTGTVE